MGHRRSTHRAGRAAAVLVAAASVVGCGATRSGQGSPFSESERGSALLRVENHSHLAADVHLIWNRTMRVPLGAVEALNSRTWTLPPARIAKGPGLVNGSFQLEARFHPTREVHRSDVRNLADGSRWSWQLENDMAFATLFVRRGGGM